ncbi:MAG: sigma-54 dependent transcriptional regulator [Ignavibacteria bacterium]|nr:sigma-54 dependent transcriptional regulator [Ignavibacteria bacterium]
MRPLLLIIDDDNDFISDFSLLLKNDYDSIFANNGTDGIKIVQEKMPDVVLLDLMLKEGESGLDVLDKIKNEDEDVPVILITDYASVDTAVDAIKRGAYNYVTKTPNLKELKLIIERSLQQRLLKYQTKTLQQELLKPFDAIIGVSREINKVKEMIKISADVESTILITGESGSGKELVARQIHIQSLRKNKPFVAINCAALPKDLIESELFGYEKGAFTGATNRKPGKFEIAADGTIFLDEISELDLKAQVKLLRILQEREFERVGGTQVIKTYARVIAASNRNLSALVEAGLFREDLFYRLDVFPIHVPALRDRREDIPLLLNYFANLTSKELKVKPKYFNEESVKLLMNYNWPGNIRELQNHITRAILLTKAEIISPDDLDFSLRKTEDEYLGLEIIPETWEEMDSLRKKAVELAARKVEKLFLEFILNKYEGNISRAADAIGINRANLHKMIKKCGLHKD